VECHQAAANISRAKERESPRGFFHVWGHAAELKIAAVAFRRNRLPESGGGVSAAGRQNKWPTCKSMRRELALRIRTHEN
jgi:hypothetical protein